MYKKFHFRFVGFHNNDDDDIQTNPNKQNKEIKANIIQVSKPFRPSLLSIQVPINKRFYRNPAEDERRLVMGWVGEGGRLGKQTIY